MKINPRAWLFVSAILLIAIISMILNDFMSIWFPTDFVILSLAAVGITIVILDHKE